jgi:xanthosine utilization system XapX-like protein
MKLYLMSPGAGLLVGIICCSASLPASRGRVAGLADQYADL